MTDAAAAARPLAGVRVLDLSRVFAGPVAGRVLADLGADVVKIEPPEGDVTRLWGHKAAGISTYFLQQNCGKRNVCVDLRRPGGPELVAELAAAADVVIENFRPGVLARFGLDWASLSAHHPELVMVSISGFGQDGPESQRAAYASVVHAETGHNDQDGAPDADLNFSAADVISGLHGVIGLLAALRVRDATGIGQHIDIAMMDAMTFSSDRVIDSLDDRRTTERRNGEIWQTACGPVSLAGGLRWVWHQMSNTHGLVDDSAADASLDDKLAARRRVVTAFLQGLPDRDSVIDALDRADLAWGELRGQGGVFESPTIVHRDTVAIIDDRAGATRPVVRVPYRMSISDSRSVGTVAHRGEHNVDVCDDWLGLSAEQVAELGGQGILLTDEWADALAADA